MVHIVSSFSLAGSGAISQAQQKGEEISRVVSRLSSGSRIPQASDDVAAMAISTRQGAEISALQQAALNVGTTSSMLQIADGGMSEHARARVEQREFE